MNQKKFTQGSIVIGVWIIGVGGAVVSVPDNFEYYQSNITPSIVKQYSPKVTTDLYTEGIHNLLFSTATPYIVAIDIMNVDKR